jgi:hypothetical protein
MNRPFKPGDEVVWLKRVPGGGYVFPVPAKVLAVTAKRVKIDANDEERRGVRYVQPESLQLTESAKSKGKAKSRAKAPRGPAKAKAKAKTKAGSAPDLVVWGRESTPPKDEAREHRITFEVVVDAYGPEEQAMGWYYYLEDKLNVPFRARCVEEREVSPLSLGDEVEVVGMPRERECEREMFVSVAWGKRTLAVPLSQLEAVEADDETEEAVADWHYWVGQGYCFC